MVGRPARHRRVRFVLPPVLVALLLAGGCWSADPPRRPGGSPPAPSGGAAPEGLPAGTSEHTLTVDGRRRTFRVYRPATLARSAPAPLVVMLHGALGSGSQAQSSYGWNAEADRGDFLVAYPDGIRRAWAVSPGCCGPPARSNVDDVGFVERMVSTIAAKTPVDPARIYATGISNGGMLAYRLGCDTTLFAAIGVTSATLLGPCPAPAPTSVIHLHGTADRTVPYGGGPGRRDNGGQGAMPADTAGPAVPALVDTWRRVAGCGAATVSVAGAVTTSAATCPEGRGVTLVTIAGAGHQWPGQPGPGGAAARALLDPPSPALDGTAVIWAFFSVHPGR
ncbi:PHB depolymerase family esterase [Micromonosporaceae bacterium B7E4]